MTSWEVRTNGHRFIVCDAASAPSRSNPDYLPRYSWPTLADAEAAMRAVAKRLGQSCTPPATRPRVEVCDPPRKRSRQVPGWLSPC
jgi:hypothetical protein